LEETFVRFSELAQLGCDFTNSYNLGQ